MKRAGMFALALFLATVANAGPQEQAVADGLRGVMTEAADGLADGHRGRATEALNRALHLAEFADHAAPDTEGPFKDALDAIRQARHELQMGRPGAAMPLLRDGAEELSARATPVFRPVDPEFPDVYEGHPVLNAEGRRLGKLDTLDNAGTASIAFGGFLGFGQEHRQVPASDLLAGGRFIVVPRPVAPKAFRGE